MIQWPGQKFWFGGGGGRETTPICNIKLLKICTLKNNHKTEANWRRLIVVLIHADIVDQT